VAQALLFTLRTEGLVRRFYPAILPLLALSLAPHSMNAKGQSTTHAVAIFSLKFKIVKLEI
jgi:hypothetical protein